MLPGGRGERPRWWSTQRLAWLDSTGTRSAQTRTSRERGTRVGVSLFAPRRPRACGIDVLHSVAITFFDGIAEEPWHLLSNNLLYGNYPPA